MKNGWWSLIKHLNFSWERYLFGVRSRLNLLSNTRKTQEHTIISVALRATRSAQKKVHSLIDNTWIMDKWKFAHRAKLEIEIEGHWTPKLTWQHDCALMDLALTLHFDTYQLRCINTCRLYLKVITISDVTNARGDRVLSLFSSRPNWDSPPRQIACRRGGGESQFGRGDRHCGSLGIYVLCGTASLENLPNTFCKKIREKLKFAGDFWCVFPLSIDSGRTHVKSSKW